MSKLHRKDGFLTRYGFACGYIQEAWHSSKSYFVRMYQDGGGDSIIVVELVRDEPSRVVLVSEMFEPWDDGGRDRAFREAERYYRTLCTLHGIK